MWLRRSPWLCVVLLTGLAGALCNVPLFNLLGFESALALAIAASFVGAWLGVRALQVAAPATATDQEVSEAPGAAVLRLYVRAAGSAVLLLLPPLVLLLGNGLRVRNCDYLAGLGFFLMMPVASVLCAVALGLTCALWLRRFALPVAVLLLVAIGLVSTLFGALASPAVFAYDPFFGYFPGSLYDEEVAIGAPFYYARLYHAAWALAALALSAAALVSPGSRPAAPDRPSARLAGLRQALTRGPRRRALLVATLSLLAALGLRQQRGALGFDRDARAVRKVLTRERLTRHFVLRYTPGGAVARDIDLIAREHELRYAQLVDTLGARPDWQVSRARAALLDLETRRGPDGPLVVSYLFESAQQKAELMGAAHTYIAKPWRREIYLQHAGWPHPVLKHELAHVFAGAAGDPLLRLSRRGLLPELGLIEGLAVAADWAGGRLTVHQQARALREARLAPAPTSLFGLAFWSQPSSRAYVIAGSFCRYLLDRYNQHDGRGAARLLALYRAGGSAAAVQLIYGQPLAALAADWGRFVDAQPLPPAEREIERERARRPAVFYKVCAHELALRRQRAREAVGRGEPEEARRLLRSVCQDDPAEPQHLLTLAETLWGLGLLGEAVAVGQELLQHPATSAVLRGRALERRGDEAALRGDLTAARAAWQAAAVLPTDEAAARTLTVKVLLSQPALAQGDGGDARAARRMLPVLVGDPGGSRDGALDLLAMHQATDDAPAGPLCWYLLGRQLLNRQAFPEAAAAMARALALPANTLPLPDERFVVEARKGWALALLRAGETEAAAAAFRAQAAAQPPGAAGRRLELADWAERAARWEPLGAAAGVTRPRR